MLYTAVLYKGVGVVV